MKKPRKIKEKIKNLWEWYILGYYHCDHCPYSWEDMDYEGECNDCGCWIFGELRDTCRHIRNPISRMIVNKHKNEEYEYQSGGWIEYANEYELCQELHQKITEEIQDNIFVPDKLREFIEKNNAYYGTELIREIVHEYELLAHPYKTPWQKLREAFTEWRKDFAWKHIKCYFRRKKK